MGEYSYELANDLDRAWINFELDLPLKAPQDGDGSVNPFYVNRPGDTLNRLHNELISPFYAPPKIFISGHKGTGKSTELFHIFENTEIQKKFWPVIFSIREETDIIDIDFQDLLLAIGSQLYREYKKAGGKLPSKLLGELESWHGEVEVEIMKAQGKIVESEISAGIDAFFANAGLKMKIEPDTRKTIRQILKPRTQELILIINEISSAIYSREHRIPLIIIDDLDKPDLDRSKRIFGQYLDMLLSPNCAIIYVVSQALFYSNEFDAIRDRSYTLSAIKLHQEKYSEKIYKPGYQMLESMVLTRISRNLITDEALDTAIRFSGGVARELCRLVRTAIGRARIAKNNSISVDDISWAITEISNEYRKFLDQDDLAELVNIKMGGIRWSERATHLLQILAVLEYVDDNGQVWHDVHPVLNEMLKRNNEANLGDAQIIQKTSSTDLDQESKIDQDEHQTIQDLEQAISNGVKQESTQIADEILQFEVDLKSESHINEKNALEEKAENNLNSKVWNELGNSYLQADDYDEAIAAYNKAIVLDRENALAYGNLGLVYTKLGRFTEAMLLLQRSLELSTNNTDRAVSWNRLGNVYRRLNDYSNAIVAYQKADELEQSDEGE